MIVTLNDAFSAAPSFLAVSSDFSAFFSDTLYSLSGHLFVYWFLPHTWHITSFPDLFIIIPSVTCTSSNYIENPMPSFGTTLVPFASPFQLVDRSYAAVKVLGYSSPNIRKALWTCSSPRRTFFLHVLSSECTSKLYDTFMSKFSVYSNI